MKNDLTGKSALLNDSFLSRSPNAPENEVLGFSTSNTGGNRARASLRTEKSAILSSPSENRLVSVISYQLDNVVVLDFEQLASLRQDLNQCEVPFPDEGVEVLKLMLNRDSEFEICSFH